MARLLVVSRSMALALRLADVHQITEHPSDELDALSPDAETDVVVLDVGDPAVAIQTLDALREDGTATPVLIVSGYQPEWTGLLSLKLPAARVVPLPITRSALLTGITALLGQDGIEAPVEPERELPVDPFPSALEPVAAGNGAEPHVPGTDDADEDDVHWDEPAPEPGESVEPTRSDEIAARSPFPVAPAPTSATEPARRSLLGRRGSGVLPQPSARAQPARREGSEVPISRDRTRLPSTRQAEDLSLPDDPAARLPVARSSGSRTQPPGVDELVGLLLERVSELFGVSDTAQVLADEMVERADADAAAVLIPDDHLWRVAGGVGLRPLERRLVMDSSTWLVAETAVGGKALIIEDTDIVRPKLAGTPLAAWKHLLAVPIGDIRAAVVLGRGAEAGAFSDRELTAIVGPVREAAGLLHRAIQTRRLARLLGPLRDADPTAGRPR